MTEGALPAVVRWVGARVPMRQVIWIKRFLREEHPWQRRQRLLREHADAAQEPVHTLRFKGRPVTVMTRGYDAIEAVTHNTSQVAAALQNRGTEHVQLPRVAPYDPLFVIRQGDVREALEALATLREADGWSIRVENEKGRFLTPGTARRRPEDVFRIIVSRPLVGPSGHRLSTDRESVVIEPWALTRRGEPRVDGSTHIEGTVRRRLPSRGPLVEYLAPDAWTQANTDGNRVRLPAPHLYAVTEPVDVVYTWVNDADPEWQARKRQASGLIDDHGVNGTALSASRFANRDELRYSLRSVEAYASWVNHIYIVTDQQVPEWLDTTHPKITVVDHREIFSDPGVLPVFNSHAIESQLHHIPGLSERYLYMNDDVFFMRPVSPDRFFTGSGLSKFFPSRAPLDLDQASARDLPVLAAAKNGRKFMLAHHGRVVTNRYKHTPHPQLRSVLQELEAAHPELFRAVASSKFRAPEDYSIASSLYHAYAYVTRRAVIGDIAYDYLDIASSRAALRLEWFSYQNRLEVVCLNDTDVPATDQERVSRLLAEFLERRFSVMSSFER